MQPPTFESVVGAVLSFVAAGTISYIAVVGPTTDLKNVALGLLGGIVVAGNGFFLRAKVQLPTQNTKLP